MGHCPNMDSIGNSDSMPCYSRNREVFGELNMKITVKKNPPKRAEVYDRLLEGEDKKNFLRRIAEVLIKSEREEKDGKGIRE